jgi:ATP-dependent 26S proteasome regulatory subunit
VIDGVASPEGQIVIATTNNKRILDSALIRPGRISEHFEFKFPTAEEIRKLYLWFYYMDLELDDAMLTRSESFANGLSGFKARHAEVQRYLLIHKKDPSKAVTDLAEWREHLEELKSEEKA